MKENIIYTKIDNNFINKNYKKIIKNNIIINFLKCLNIFIFIIITIYIFINTNIFDKKIFINKIQEKFFINGKVNLNEIENELFSKESSNLEIYNSLINIGFTLDPGYIFQTMLTLTNIMSTQYNTTKIIFHLGVINNFSAENMLKIYELRKKINNLTEFNFYYLRGAMEKMKNFHSKGEACPGKFELPELLPDNVDKLLIFDAGDVLVFRDLTELYNYNMEDSWALGTPEPQCIALVLNDYNITKYLNIGSILLNVKELKKNNFWDTYTKNRNLKLLGAPDQTLFNILTPDNKKKYFPFRFGGICPFKNDNDFDKLIFNDMGIINWLTSELGNLMPENKKNQINYIVQLFNPVFIHQFSDKWKNGSGLSIYRNLVKYYIHLAGIWNELCKLEQGYCY
jgi:hypothetical protein